MNSSLRYSAIPSLLFVTRKMVLTMSTAEYPAVQSSSSPFNAPSMSAFSHDEMMLRTVTGCGRSHTLNTASGLTKPNPECVDCRLLMACRMSPSAVKTIAARPSDDHLTWEADLDLVWLSDAARLIR